MTTSRPAPRAAARARGLHAAALAVLLAAPAARAGVEPLALDLRRDLAIIAGAAVGDLVLSAPAVKPERCGWCEHNRFDDWARDRVRWSRPALAGTASDLLAGTVIPLAVAGNSLYFALRERDPRLVWEDGVVIVQAVSLAAVLNGLAKNTAARRRPDAAASAGGSANRSFYSGHTSIAFSLAAAAGTVSTLRGYPTAPWVWAGGLSLASATAYLRVAADAHWGTDVLVGAAVSGAVGWAVPWFLHRARRPGAGVEVLPAPGGLALVF